MSAPTGDSPLSAALRQFDATEANLKKLERIWAKIKAMIPAGLAFCEDEEHEDLCRVYCDILKAMPSIDGLKPSSEPMSLNEIAQHRLDAQEVQQIECFVATEEWINAPHGELREYRHKLNSKRRELIRETVLKLISQADEDLRILQLDNASDKSMGDLMAGASWESFMDCVSQLGTLMGSSISLPKRWSDLSRHIRFGQLHDLRDIIQFDWPDAKSHLMANVYDADDPLPVSVADLADIVNSKPRGHVATQLKWGSLTPEEFERLIFVLISSTPGYENPNWLMHANAPDRGRDLSVHRVFVDKLGGTTRRRVIIQCKHWLSKAVSLSDIALLREQLPTWQPPRVDDCIIATSGRFTADCVLGVEQRNQGDTALNIELWPESHLEMILAARPDIIAEFKLR